LLTATGLKFRSFQETRRETWQLGEVEIVLDEWPWLDPYMEIEGPTEADLKEVAEKLGLDWNEVVYGDVMAAYRAQYPHLKLHETVGDLAEVRFNAPLPDFLKP
jgi:adenylate cyclase class 2